MRFLSVLTILSLFLASCVVKSQRTSAAMYTKEDILRDLDDLFPYKSLPDFELSKNGLAGSRITLFADTTRWAIVFETTDCDQYGELALYYFGNCLVNQKKQGLYEQFLDNTAFFRLISKDEYARIVESAAPSLGLIRKEVKEVKVRGSYLPIDQDLRKYEQKEINIDESLNPQRLIDYPSLIRYLDEENPELFRATDEELRSLLPKDLPKLFVINQWHHKSYYVFPDSVNKPYGDKPSSYETYQMIADIIVSKDTTRWKPTLQPNNDWRNWVNSESY